jgi:hypothetical protein
MKKNSILLSTYLLGLLCFSHSQAALEGRGGGLVYDTVLNITWLADGNYAQTSGYNADGRMDWYEANSWASQVEYAGHSDWRLPDTSISDPTCSGQGTRTVDGTAIDWGFGCTGSELGHLYQDLGGTAGGTILGSGDEDLELFVNLMAEDYSGTDHPLDEYWSTLIGSSSRAYHFHLFNGFQRDIDTTNFTMFALLVHDGDISPVPLPAAFWLFAAGIAGVYGFGRQTRRSSLDLSTS